MSERITAAMRARARGCLLGQLVGDSLGTTVEFESSSRIRERYPDGLRDIIGGGPFDVLPGQVTDDSELALALARTLVSHGADLDAVARAYVAWCESGPFDIGGTTLNAFHFPPDSHIDAAVVTARAEAYNSHPKKQANGALMRVSPLGIYGALLPAERLADLARADARLSHPTAPCREASVAFTRAIAVAISEHADIPRMYAAALAAVDTEIGHESGVYGWLIEAADPTPPTCDGHGIGWVKTSFLNAFFQLLHAETCEDGLIATVMAGGDSDTNACIAGALLGAAHGELDIPSRWRETVLACRTDRGATYQNADARELAIALLERGVASAR